MAIVSNDWPLKSVKKKRSYLLASSANNSLQTPVERLTFIVLHGVVLPERLCMGFRTGESEILSTHDIVIVAAEG